MIDKDITLNAWKGEDQRRQIWIVFTQDRLLACPHQANSQTSEEELALY